MPWWRLFYHLIWATRERRPLITAAIEDDVRRVIMQSAIRHDVQVHAIGTVEDHVHLVVTISPSLAIATAVRNIKGASAHTLNQLLDVDFGWQPEYGVVSFAERHLQDVVAYVLNQRQHHAERRLWSALEKWGADNKASTVSRGDEG